PQTSPNTVPRSLNPRVTSIYRLSTHQCPVCPMNPRSLFLSLASQ
ncbi:hypothetical protein L914_20770, partial [Phytophthora nicotianae]